MPKVSNGLHMLHRAGRPARSLTNETSGRPQWVDYVAPGVGNPESPWTSIQCVGWRRNRSCAFDRLYYDSTINNFVIVLPGNDLGNVKKAAYTGGAFDFNGADVFNNQTDTGTPVTETSVREILNGVSSDAKDRKEAVPFHPQILFFKDESVFVQWKRRKQRNFFSWLTGSPEPQLVSGTSLHWQFFGALNPGHFLYDSFYPAWVTAVRFGHTFDALNMVPLGDDGSKRARGIFWSVPYWTVLESFGRGAVFLTTDLKSPLTVFSRLLVGSRFMGHRNPQRSMAMPGSYSYENALFWFGQRLLAGFDLAPWPKPELHVADADPDEKCRGVITDNKRFDEEMKSMLKDIAANSAALLDCDITFLEWEDHSFAEQLDIIGRSHLYISSTGTGLTRCHLTKPGGVVVHLGSMELLGDPQRYQVSYRDVHFATGSSHLGSVYYPRRLWNIYGRLQREGIIDTIQRGVELMRSGFSIPRPYADGLSPTSDIWERYCESTDDNCKAMVDVQNGNFEPGQPHSKDTYMCEYCSWADYFELAPMWSPIGCRDGDSTVHCPLDHHLYRSAMDADHVAFDPDCYNSKVGELQVAKHEVLKSAAAKLKKNVEELSPSEAVAAMLEVEPPECPFKQPSQPPPCAC
ncbi:hypothetical protein FOZ61_003800 [Perkinsus olseni]|uniref:Uncharacterized protein n=1 Tax=Perkinsus olseni TaxID=32597 RepID=A0A7J6LN99_PEROL|nr:hypothetical protein FOZ61_003800 [Perkinsus olseni]